VGGGDGTPTNDDVLVIENQTVMNARQSNLKAKININYVKSEAHLLRARIP